MAEKTKSTSEKKGTLTFEKSIDRLTEIADILENANPSLNDALTLYEEGARLLKSCTSMLDDAQKKITVLSKDGSCESTAENFTEKN